MRTSRKAIASLLLGIATLIGGLWTAGSQSLPVFVLTIIFCLIALILGILGRREVTRSESELYGKGMAGCGIGMSIAGPILGLVLANAG
jgi:hypothetical protein